MKFQKTLRVAAICLALPPVARAEDVIQLSDVKVNASQPENRSAFVGTARDAAELSSRRASSDDAASLLRDLPGVSLYGAGGVSSLPAIHGLADDRLRIQVDGMDLAAACPNHMNPPLSYLDPNQVAAISVWAGITPVSVGGDSIGGTIAAVTAAPEFAEAGQGRLVKGHVGAFYRSNGHAHGGNAAALLAGEQVSLNYSGSIAQSDNLAAGGKFKTTTATGRPGHELPLDEIGSSAYKAENHALGIAVRSDAHLFEAKVGYQHIPYELYPNQRMDMLGNTQQRYRLRYQGRYGWGALEALAYRETVRHHMDFGGDKQYIYGAAPGIVAPGMPMDTRSRNTGARVTASVGAGEGSVLRLGGELQRYRLDDWWPPSPAALPAGFAYGGMAPNVFWNVNDGRRDRDAAFGEWESKLDAQWLTLFGARYERVKSDAGPVQGYNDVYAGYVNAAAAFNARDRARIDGNWDASVLARHVADDRRTIEFGYAMKTRSPNLYERYSWSTNGMALEMNNFVGDGNGYVGNPDLKPEVAHMVSATADWHAGDRAWEFKATPYYTHVDDFIDARRCAGRGSMMNAICGGAANATAINKFVHLQYANVSARLVGIDLSGRMPIGESELGAFGLRGLVNYVRSRNLETGQPLYNTMPLNAMLALTHKLGGWDNRIEVVGVQAKRDVSEVRNEIKTPGYGLVHVRGSYVWKMVRIDVGVENLFNRLYFPPTAGAYTGQGMTMSTNGIPWGLAVPGPARSIYVAAMLDF